MNKRYITALSAVMYFTAVIAFILLFCTNFTVFILTHTEKFITATVVFVFAYLGTILKCKTTENDKNKENLMRNTVLALCLVYVIIVVDFTLFDDSFGRDFLGAFTDERLEISEHIKNRTNFIPFATVELFVNGYKNGLLSFSAFIENILGNFFVFTPFAFFIPLLIRKVNSFWKFFVFIAIVVIFIEGSQLVLRTGATDIDDFILNVGGAVAVYAVLHSKRFSYLLNKITVGLWEKKYEK